MTNEDDQGADMPSTHPDFPTLRIFGHPLIQQKLTQIRDRDTPTVDFRLLLNQVAGLMTFQVSRDFPIRAVEVETPLERAAGTVLAAPVTLVPILRAGVGMTDGVLALIHNEVKYKATVDKDFGSVPLIQCQEADLGRALLLVLVNAARAR